MREDVMVDVLMPVYNHGRFLKQAIESVVNQKTNFKFRLIIGEDVSTDNSRQIIEGYSSRYPDIILPIYNKINLGGNRNALNLYSVATAKYLAFCEGDDFWTDNNKLQIQVNCLEQNEDCSVCFTNIDVMNDQGDKFYVPEAFLNFTRDFYTIEDIISHPMDKPLALPTMTMVFRNNLPSIFPDFYSTAIQADTALTLLLGMEGKFIFIPVKTAVYRQHSGGVTKSKEFQFKFERSMFDLMDSFNEYSNHKYHNAIKQKLYPMSKTLLMYGSSLLKGNERKEHIARMMKGYKKYRPSVNRKEIAYYIIVLYFPFILNIHKFLSKK